jgi:hypothetical protein
MRPAPTRCDYCDVSVNGRNAASHKTLHFSPLMVSRVKPTPTVYALLARTLHGKTSPKVVSTTSFARKDRLFRADTYTTKKVCKSHLCADEFNVSALELQADVFFLDAFPREAVDCCVPSCASL